MPVQCDYCGRWWDRAKLTRCPECGEEFDIDDEVPAPDWTGCEPVTEEEINGDWDVDDILNEIEEDDYEQRNS